MNVTNLHDMVHSARCEGYREGRDKGWREAKAVLDYDKGREADRARGQGIIIGTCIGVFLSAFWLLLFGLGWMPW